MARFVEIDGEQVHPEWVVRFGPIDKITGDRTGIPCWAKTWVRVVAGPPLYSPLDVGQVKALLEGDGLPGAGQGGGPPARVPAAVLAEEGRSDEGPERMAAVRQAWAAGGG
jgi:hypothetical protein